MRLFIGREQILSNIARDLAGPPAKRFINLHGPGGIGKTTLKEVVLERLEQMAPETARMTLDETGGRMGLLDALEFLADRTAPPRDLPTPRFARLRHAIQIIRRLRGRLLDSHAPEGLLAGIDERLEAGPETGPAPDGRQRMAYEAAVHAWTRDREEQDLLLYPMRALAMALREDLREGLRPQQGWERLLQGPAPQAPARVLLVLDSHEALHPALGHWLLAWCLPTLDAPGSGIDLRLLVCGRQRLKDTDPLRRWDVHAHQTREVDLAHFGQEEVAAYLAARGLDPVRADEALEASGGLPFLLALWCDTDGKGRGLALQQAARRIRWWKAEEGVRWMETAAFLGPISLDALEIGLEDPAEARAAFAWLTTHAEALDHDDAGRLVLAPVVAGILRDALRQESPRRADRLDRLGRGARAIARLEAELGPLGPDWAALLTRLPDAPLAADVEAPPLWQGMERVLARSPEGEALREGLRCLWSVLPAERRAILTDEAHQQGEAWQLLQARRAEDASRRALLATRADQLTRRAEELRRELEDLQAPAPAPRASGWSFAWFGRRPLAPVPDRSGEVTRTRQVLADIEAEIGRCRLAAGLAGNP